MLTVPGAKRSQFCDGFSRRDFLRVGGLGMGGLTLAEVLRLQAHGADGAKPARKKSVIMIMLPGGPSHIDMYDLKPDAPVEYRGEFKPIHTNVPGMDICELMPLQAKIADKFSLLRGVKTPTGNHYYYTLFRGIPVAGGKEVPSDSEVRPAFGSVISKLRGTGADGMPPYAALHQQDMPVRDRPSVVRESAAYLGQAHQGFVPSGGLFDNLKVPADMTLDRLADRTTLLQSFDTLRRDIDSKGDLAGMDSFTTQALDMISTNKVRTAFDLSREPAKVRENYGPKAGNYLLARRLVEAGVSLVTLTSPAPPLGWDTHGGNFKTLRNALPILDKGLYALITELHDRGLSDDVAVVMWGEMGRAPKIGKVPGLGGDGNQPDGRHHWLDASFALVAGGGLNMGQVIGETNPRAEYPTSRVYTQANVYATLYGVLGIDPAHELPDHTGRPRPLLDNTEKIQEL